MAHVILGLLMLTPATLYDLTRYFQQGVALFYSSSTGSIKRALDQLLAAEQVEVASVETTGRGRKVYRVTQAGRSAFASWMVEEPTGDLETAALSRLYFLGLVEADQRRGILDGIGARLDHDLAALHRLRSEVSAAQVPTEMEDVARYQRATLDYGIASHELARVWFRKLASEMKNAPDWDGARGGWGE